jgi:hypothetical protein
MDASLRLFVSQYVGAVAATLVPVIIVTFMSMPLSLGGHPGEPRRANAIELLHFS